MLGSLRIIGVLGGVASGKSLVARQFSELGAGLLEADRAGHEVLREPEIKAALRNRFSEAVLDNQGDVDRRALALVVNPESGGVSAPPVTALQKTIAAISLVVRPSEASAATGIDGDQLESLFQPFKQVADSQVASNGSGIGLALVKKVAEDLSGTASLERDGEMTRATLRLPLAPG